MRVDERKATVWLEAMEARGAINYLVIGWQQRVAPRLIEEAVHQAWEGALAFAKEFLAGLEVGAAIIVAIFPDGTSASYNAATGEIAAGRPGDTGGGWLAWNGWGVWSPRGPGRQ